MSSNKKEPLIHIVKRGSIRWYHSMTIRGAAVVLSLLVCALLIRLLTGKEPVDVYVTIFKASFDEPRLTWQMVYSLAVLLCVGLALLPAFRMRFWNLGAEGQILAGGLATAACMICLKDTCSHEVILVCMVISGMLAGAIWGVIPAIFKAKWNTNETLFTLMMNYVAIQIVAYFGFVWEKSKGAGTIGIINQREFLDPVLKAKGPRKGWLPDIHLENLDPKGDADKYLLTIIVAVALLILITVYLNYTKHGYEISVVGESQRTARYVGIKVGKVIIRTMILSGAMCGLVGVLLVGGMKHTLNSGITEGRGFVAVMVAWLAKLNPVWMTLTSFLIVFLEKGSIDLSSNSELSLDKSFSDILTGIILFFIIGSEFFVNYRICFRHKSGKEDISHV